MYPVSQRFLAAIRTGGQRKTVADVYYGGVFLQTLPISDGRVTLDRGSLTLASGSLTVGDPNLVPILSGSPLSPINTEIRIRTGPAGYGWQELVPLGIFRLQNTNYSEAGGYIPDIEFYDRSQGLLEANFLVPVDRSGYTVKSTLATFIKDIYPNCTITFCSDPGEQLKFPGGTIFQTSRTDAIQTCLTVLNSEGHFDEFGNFFVVDIPGLEPDTPYTDSVYTIKVGENGTLVDASHGVTRDGICNGVTMYGATDDTGKQAVGQAFDTDIKSPTYFGVPVLNPAGLVSGTKNNTGFQMVTAQLQNDSLTTNDQCVAAAQAYLKDHKGLARSLSLTCASNPALRPGDTILVIFLDGTDELHIIDTMDIPLAGGDMNITTRTLTYRVSPVLPPAPDPGSANGISWYDVATVHATWQDVLDTRISWQDVIDRA